MKLLPSLFVLFNLALSSIVMAGTQIHVCEDEEGNRTYEKHCPPGSKSISSKNYSLTTGKSGQAKSLPPLVLYAVPNCEVCDQVRNVLSERNLQVTEKNVKDNGALQQELKSKTGGDLRVPVLLVGDKVVAGYNQENLKAALEEAGYELPVAEEKTASK